MMAYKETYGSDIDGNRGEMRWEFELDDSDAEEVIAILRDAFEGMEPDEYPTYYTVSVYCEATDGYVDFEVDVRDYL